MDEDAMKTDQATGTTLIWDVLSVPCKGPCWNARWYVFQKRGLDVGDYYVNESGNVKRFRSEEAARKVADKLNRWRGQ